MRKTLIIFLGRFCWNYRKTSNRYWEISEIFYKLRVIFVKILDRNYGHLKIIWQKIRKIKKKMFLPYPNKQKPFQRPSPFAHYLQIRELWIQLKVCQDQNSKIVAHLDLEWIQDWAVPRNCPYFGQYSTSFCEINIKFGQ